MRNSWNIKEIYVPLFLTLVPLGNLSMVWDISEIYSECIKEVQCFVLFCFVVVVFSSENSLRSRKLKQKISLVLMMNNWDTKEIHMQFFSSIIPWLLNVEFGVIGRSEHSLRCFWDLFWKIWDHTKSTIWEARDLRRNPICSPSHITGVWEKRLRC